MSGPTRMKAMRTDGPFPWFGRKTKVAPLVWEKLGAVKHYVEPFFGSGAVLLARPGFPFRDTHLETVNDLDGYLTNFWRALQSEPEAVAKHCDWPVGEVDLIARHAHLLEHRDETATKMKADPLYFDPVLAGWWVWGINQWIGGGWCEVSSASKLPKIAGSGCGVHNLSVMDGRPDGEAINEWFADLAFRLRHVRVACGSWERVLSGAILRTPPYPMGVFLDPPYDTGDGALTGYSVGEGPVEAGVREWCAENGSNPRIRIVLAGYAGNGNEALEEQGWGCVGWKAAGGYGNHADGEGRANASRERLWYSPHCTRGLLDFG